MKNIFLFIIIFVLPFTAKSQDNVAAKINSHIRSASNTQKITKDTLAGVLSVINQKVNSLDSMNWKMTGNMGLSSVYKLSVNVPRLTGMHELMKANMLFGFNVDSFVSNFSNYGYMRLNKIGNLELRGQRQNGEGDPLLTNVEISGTRITNRVNYVGGSRFKFAESEILNGEISGFSHRIIKKDGISQYFHGILFAQGLDAIQTGTGYPYLSYMAEQNVGSLFIDGETGIGYMKKRPGRGIEKYNQITTSRIYTPTSTADASGEVGEIAHDNDYVYFKTVAGWKRVFLGSF